MKSPHHIQGKPYGYIVRFASRAKARRIWVSKNRPGALAMACKVRDAALRGRPGNVINTKPRSNTGIVGISESTRWQRGRPTPCFQVSWRDAGVRKTKRILFGAIRARSVALKMAIKLRKEKTAC